MRSIDELTPEAHIYINALIYTVHVQQLDGLKYYSGGLIHVLYDFGLIYIMPLAKPSLYSSSDVYNMRTHTCVHFLTGVGMISGRGRSKRGVRTITM